MIRGCGRNGSLDNGEEEISAAPFTLAFLICTMEKGFYVETSVEILQVRHGLVVI